MNDRMEAREKARRDIVLEAQGDLSEQAEQALKQNVVTNALHHQLNANVVENELQTMSAYENAFRKIKECVACLSGEIGSVQLCSQQLAPTGSSSGLSGSLLAGPTGARAVQTVDGSMEGLSVRCGHRSLLGPWQVYGRIGR